MRISELHLKNRIKSHGNRDTVAILAYFNFSRKKAREMALQETLRNLGRQVDIILVGYGLPTNCHLPADDIQIITIRSSSIVWQKERFLIIALSYFRHNHKYVIWMDADILLSQYVSKNYAL